MTIQRQGDLLNISQLEQLAAANSHSFHSTLAASLPADITHIDIDLSKTNFVDCGGIGALVALRKCVRNSNREVTIRLLNPSTSARRILQLTRMADLFAIEPALAA